MKKQFWLTLGLVSGLGVALQAHPVHAATITLQSDQRLAQTAGEKQSGEALKAGTSWRVSQAVTKDKNVWLELGRNQWLPVEFPGTLQLTKETPVYSAPTIPASLSKKLAAGSQWQFFDVQLINDTLWYSLGGHQWINLEDAQPQSGQDLTVTPHDTIQVQLKNKDASLDYLTDKGFIPAANSDLINQTFTVDQQIDQPDHPAMYLLKQYTHVIAWISADDVQEIPDTPVTFTQTVAQRQSVTLRPSSNESSFYLTDDGLKKAKPVKNLQQLSGLTTRRTLVGSDGSQFDLIEQAGQQLAWVNQKSVQKATMSVQTNQTTIVYNDYGKSRQYSYRTLPANTNVTYYDHVTDGDTTWYSLGHNQWFTLDSDLNQMTPESLNAQTLTLTSATPIYSDTDHKQQVGQLAANDTATIEAVKTVDHRLWYQNATGWFSPAYEVTKNWHYQDQPVRLPILMYHDFEDTVTSNIYAIPAAQFKQQLDWLDKAGYQTLTPDQAYYALTTNYLPTSKVVWMTMDDGYQSWYRQIMPLVQESGVHVTGFQIVNRMDSNWSLNPSEIKTLMAAGFNLESHTMNHVKLGQQGDYTASQELTESKADLQKQFDAPITTIAYPYGSYTNKTENLTQAAGYQMGLAMDNRVATLSDSLYALPRITVTPDLSKQAFLDKLQ